MITLYGFGRVHKAVIGGTRDLRVEWALQEMGLPYRVHPVDHTAGEMKTEEFGQLNPLHLLPIIEDDGFRVAESGAILLYLAEKSGRLIPPDLQGRTLVTQWCFAALSTVERPCQEIQLIDLFGKDDEAKKSQREEMVTAAHRWLDSLERRLHGRQWIATDEFTVADILLATVLREIRKTDLLHPYELITAYYERAFSRPAWHQTLHVYAERLGVDVASIA